MFVPGEAEINREAALNNSYFIVTRAKVYLTAYKTVTVCSSKNKQAKTHLVSDLLSVNPGWTVMPVLNWNDFNDMCYINKVHTISISIRYQMLS